MTLGQKQRLFSQLVAELVLYIYDSGHECTFGDAYRDPQIKNAFLNIGCSPKSLHFQRLAIDLNLFRNGRYLTSTESHRQFGEYWKTLHLLCRWGGDFSKPDGNHYSITHDGCA